MKAIEVEKKFVPKKNGLKKGFMKYGFINGVNAVNWGKTGKKTVGTAGTKKGRKPNNGDGKIGRNIKGLFTKKKLERGKNGRKKKNELPKKNGSTGKK